MEQESRVKWVTSFERGLEIRIDEFYPLIKLKDGHLECCVLLVYDNIFNICMVFHCLQVIFDIQYFTVIEN